MTRFRALWDPGSTARRRGFYVQDVGRTRPGVVVLVGGRHETAELAETEASRLEASL